MFERDIEVRGRTVPLHALARRVGTQVRLETGQAKAREPGSRTFANDQSYGLAGGAGGAACAGGGGGGPGGGPI